MGATLDEFSDTKTNLLRAKYLIAHLQHEWSRLHVHGMSPLHTHRGVNVIAVEQHFTTKVQQNLQRRALQAWAQAEDDTEEPKPTQRSDTSKSDHPGDADTGSESDETDTSTDLASTDGIPYNDTTVAESKDQRDAVISEIMEPKDTRYLDTDERFQRVLRFRATVEGLSPDTMSLVKTAAASVATAPSNSHNTEQMAAAVATWKTSRELHSAISTTPEPPNAPNTLADSPPATYKQDSPWSNLCSSKSSDTLRSLHRSSPGGSVFPKHGLPGFREGELGSSDTAQERPRHLPLQSHSPPMQHIPPTTPLQPHSTDLPPSHTTELSSSPDFRPATRFQAG